MQGFFMSVKASVSISQSQDAFARALVKQGRYSSLSSIVQHGIELVKADTELREAETSALRALLNERAAGPFVGMTDAHAETEAMIARKRAERGL
jgi:antitoxin ParD1/3/4